MTEISTRPCGCEDDNIVFIVSYSMKPFLYAEDISARENSSDSAGIAAVFFLYVREV